MLNRVLLHAAFAATLCGFHALPAQADDVLCPDQVVEHVPAHFQVANVVSCGTGLEINIGGVSYASPPGTCALLVAYVPAHSLTKAQPGSLTYTRPVGTVHTWIGRYQCRSIKFLWVFPWSSVCEEISFSRADAVTTYAQYPCRD